MASTDPRWTRLRIHGQLECTAPLHLGDGDRGAFAERDYRDDQPADIPGGYNSVCRDGAGRPYIPASTLRGWLAARLRPADPKQAPDPSLAPLTLHLFGEAAGDTGQAGRLRCSDARLAMDPKDTALPLWDKNRHTLVQHGVKLHPRLGSVADRSLHQHEAVPVGARFDWMLEIDDVTEADLALVCGLLKALDGKAGSAVGRGVSRQAGRLHWHGERIDVLTPARIAWWLKQLNKPLDEAFETLRNWPDASAVPARALDRMGFQLLPQGPLLVNEPGLCQRKPKPQPGASAATKDDARIDAPDLEFSRTSDGRALVPAASLRGLLRARARRICATIAAGLLQADQLGQDDARIKRLEDAITAVANRLVASLFGDTGSRARIWLTEAVAIQPATTLKQTFVAIDRFTGGGEPGKLYQVRAAQSGALHGEALFDPRHGPPTPWECGLMLLLARDALEGDLAVGWGKARGYGACEVLLDISGSQVGDLSGLLAALGTGRDSAAGWIAELHQHIAHQLPAELVASSACGGDDESSSRAGSSAGSGVGSNFGSDSSSSADQANAAQEQTAEVKHA